MRQLAMLRPDLDGLPEMPAFPDGYSLRLGSPDDADSMGVMMTKSYQEPWDEARCKHVLLSNQEVYATFIAEHDGKVVGTASCKELIDQPETGYVHYVGADPDHAGRKLGYACTLATLHEFRRKGLTNAILNTDDFRLPAIRIYLQLGFVPVYEVEEHIARWSKVFERLLKS